MRINYYFSTLILLLVLSACGSSRIPSEEEQAKEKRVREMVLNKDFTVEVTQAIPMRGRSINLTSSYDIKIKNDSAYAYLPYFGVAHSAPYGGGEGGVKFATVMNEYQLSDKKDGWDIKFKAKSSEYNYEVLLTIFRNGNSTVHVSSYQKDPITFYGKVALPDERSSR